MSSTLIQNIVIGVLALVLLALGYFLFIQPNGFSLNSDAVNPLDDQVLARTQQFIAHRSELDQVNIDSSIFSDSRFTTLRSYSAPLQNQNLGKRSVFDKPASLKTAVATPAAPAQ